MKNVKKTVAGLTLFAAALSLLAPVAALADSTARTDGHINLIENNTPTDPKDPEDPKKPIEPEDPYNPPTENPGPLSLDVAPRAIEFGEQKMYSAAHQYAAIKQGADHVRQYIQVTDDREAGVYGWKVTVKQDGYLANTTTTLTGATISIPAGAARNSFNEPSTAVDTKLKTNAVTINTSEATIFETTAAGALTGKGQSTSVWLPEDVKLDIPANTAKKGDYTNTLTWTLTAVAHS